MSERTCSIVDCDKTVIARGWCSKHYYRWKRNGDPMSVTIVRDGSGWMHLGYRFIAMHDHPLADSRGHVALHRAVLFDKIGDGTHECHWCTQPVSWRVDLTTDHLDWDKGNNSPDNLVPSCNPCNAHRYEVERRGELVPGARLTEDQVRSIRLSELTDAELAATFDVSVWTIRDVRDRRNWKHVA